MSNERNVTDVVREGLLSGDDYNRWLARAEELLRDCQQLRGSARASLADELQASVEGGLPLFSDIGWLADVLGFAIGGVDWLEIATVFIPLQVERGEDRRWWGYLHTLTVEARADYVVTCYQKGHIIDHELWDVLVTHNGPLPYLVAVKVYKRLGFEPFSGYPLTKAQ